MFDDQGENSKDYIVPHLQNIWVRQKAVTTSQQEPTIYIWSTAQPCIVQPLRNLALCNIIVELNQFGFFYCICRKLCVARCWNG